MAMITLLNLQKRFPCLERKGDVHGFTPVLQSTGKDCRQDSEDYFKSGHTLLWFHLGQIYILLHLSDTHILKI